MVLTLMQIMVNGYPDSHADHGPDSHADHGQWLS
jgi:hypothetical protein